MKHIQVTFSLCDHFNPGFGYDLHISDARTGAVVLTTTRAPDTGEDLLTPADCIRVINMYAATPATEQRKSYNPADLKSISMPHVRR